MPAETGCIPAKKWKKWKAGREARCRITCLAQNPFISEFANMYHLPLVGGSGRPGDDVSGIREGTQEPAPHSVQCFREGRDSAHADIKNMAQNPNPTDGEVHVLHVQGNVYMLVGAGGNITVQVGDMGVLMVDTGLAQTADKVIAAIHKLAPGKPLQYIINTHVHPDHTGGNMKLRAAGVTITGANVTGDIADASKGAAIIAHQAVLDRMSAQSGNQPAVSADAWPTDTFLGDRKTLLFNEEPVEILHEKSAHTDGDSIVFFRHSDVIAPATSLSPPVTPSSTSRAAAASRAKSTR